MPSKVNKGLCAVAFLRGINVGGHALVKMEVLKSVFGKMGFQDMRTVMASGNVTFSACTRDPQALARGKGTPEAMSVLEREFGPDLTTRNWNTILKMSATS